MEKTFMLGRTHRETLDVPASAEGVSMDHAKVTIKDDGTWEIEDLQSTNGTYVRDSDGEYRRIYRKSITEDSMIRLGNGGRNSFIFMAHHLLAPHPADYSYEFGRLQKELRNQKRREEKLEKTAIRNMWFIKFSTAFALALCFIIDAILDLPPQVNLNMTRVLMCLAPIAAGLFFSIDPKVKRSLAERRKRIISCPKCGNPLSEFNVEQMTCPHCRAK